MTRRTMVAMTAGALAAERKNRAPISHDTLTIKLPEATPVKLSNGLTLIAMEDNRLPLAWVRFQVDGAGRLYEPRPGLAQMTAELLALGSKQRSAKQIAEEAARLGAIVSSGTSTGRETATVDASGLSTRFYDWLALTTDVLTNPTFAVDEFNSLRKRWSVLNRLREAEADQASYDTLNRLIYGSHPAAAGPPSPEELGALTLDEVGGWHRDRYAPAATVVTVIGRVKTSEVASGLEKLLGGWKTPEPKFSLPPEPQPAQRRIILIDRPGATQTQLALGNLLFPRGNTDYDPTQVLQRILGTGENSRLSRLGSSGQVLSVAGVMGTARFTGYWQVRAAMRVEATASALSSILEELRRLCEEPVPSQELEEAKSAVIGRFALTLEQPSELINYSYSRFRYGFSTDYWERSPARISAVTAGEVQAVAQKHYRPERAHIVAVGDGSKIRGALARFGMVES